MGRTAIEWTHYTFNAWWGCTKVSPACANCYAERLSKAYGHDVWGADKPRRFLSEDHWKQPIKWNAQAERAGRRFRVFTMSMGDVLEAREELGPWRARLWATIEYTPHLEWLLLTKHPANYAAMLPKHWWDHPPANVTGMVTVEDQTHAAARIPALIRGPFRRRGISAEPLLGPLRLEPWLKAIDWVIVGGETGPNSRWTSLEWIRDLRDQCHRSGTAFFVKQLTKTIDPDAGKPQGTLAWTSDDRAWLEEPGRYIYSERGAKNPDFWPEDLRLRELPADWQTTHAPAWTNRKE